MTTKPQTIGLLALCASLTFGAYCLIVLPLCVGRSDLCLAQWWPTLEHTADAPYRYRLLSVGLEAMLAPHDTPLEILLADVALHALLFPLLYAGLYLWLKTWAGAERALLGCFVLGAAQPVGFLHYYLSLYSTIELVLFVWFLYGMQRQWSYVVLVALLAVAALNRETSLLLVAAYAAYHGRSHMRPLLGLVAVWLLVTGGLHVGLGAAPHVLGWLGTLRYNVTTLLEAVFVNLLFVPLWLTTHYYTRLAPAVLNRLLWCAGLYVGSILVGAAWQEVRLLMTVFPLVLPVVLYRH